MSGAMETVASLVQAYGEGKTTLARRQARPVTTTCATWASMTRVNNGPTPQTPWAPSRASSNPPARHCAGRAPTSP